MYKAFNSKYIHFIGEVDTLNAELPSKLFLLLNYALNLMCDSKKKNGNSIDLDSVDWYKIGIFGLPI